MTDQKKQMLNDLQVRVKQVMYLCDNLSVENLRLNTELQKNNQEKEELANQLEQLKQKYDSLKLARTITAATVDVDTAKSKLSDLVREVDKCINLLSS